MPDKRICPHCGTERSDDSLSGLCPKCLVRFSFVEMEGEGTSSAPGQSPTPTFPRQFGDYEMLEEIARGGMGVVYRARQASLHRTVALKMVATGKLTSPSAVRRFHTEAEAAANLDHPNIVPIYEIGEQEGQHYFTMKLVEGASLDRRLAEFTLASVDSSEGHNTAIIRQQVNKLATLLAKVAEAVHYAHQRGILHRDLKPGNILIDQTGQPHVTDFGLAKRVEAESHLTLSGEIMGTPAYMAPEQASGNVHQVTTVADVFSLGVILYQLLTGRVPFAGTTPVEVLHAVIHHEPSTPRSLNANVPRDLETICLKCLEKDPGKRYGGANEVADELDKFVQGEPIQARPVGRAEKLWRWSRRNPALAGFVTATALLLLTVVVGAPIALWREATLRRQAEAEAVKAREVAQFLKAMLEGVSPSQALGRDTALLQEILDNTAKRVTQELGNQPDVAADLMETLGEVAFKLGQADKAETWLSRALALRKEVHGEEHAEIANTLDALAVTLYAQGKLDDARKLGLEALAMQRKFHGNNHANVATSLNNLAITLTVANQCADALDLYREALAIRTNLLSSDHPDVAITLNCMAVALQRSGNLSDAETVQRQALAIQQKILPDPHPDLALSLNNLANMLLVQGKLDLSLPYYEQALQMQRALDVAPADLATTLNNYGMLLERMGRWAESEAAHSNAFTIRTNAETGDPKNLPYTLSNLASLRADAGRFEEAQELHEQTLAMRRRLLGEDDPEVADSIANVARILRYRKQLPDAEKKQLDALARRQELPPEGEHLSVAISLTELGLIRRAQGRINEASHFLKQAFDLRSKVLRRDDSTLAESAEYLALVLCDLGQFTEAEKLARQSLAIREQNYPDGWRRYNAQAILGAALLGQEKYNQARTNLLAGYNGMEEREARIPVPEKPHLKEIRQSILQLYEATGRPEEAAQWRNKLTQPTKTP